MVEAVSVGFLRPGGLRMATVVVFDLEGCPVARVAGIAAEANNGGCGETPRGEVCLAEVPRLRTGLPRIKVADRRSAGRNLE